MLSTTESRPKQIGNTSGNVFIHHLTSKFSDQEFRIIVELPRSPIPPRHKVPVVYGLDDDLIGGLLLETARMLEGSEGFCPVITVSIAYPLDTRTTPLMLRNRELTPTRALVTLTFPT